MIEAKVERGNPLDLLLGDRLLLIASGEVVAGVDLSKLRDGDVVISPDGKRVQLTLPPSEVFNADGDRTRVYDRQQGVFAPENKDLESQARAQAELEIMNAACESNIMQKAADDARRSMEQFLKLLDFEQVTVNSSAGPCVAPAGLPAAPANPMAAPTLRLLNNTTCAAGVCSLRQHAHNHTAAGRHCPRRGPLLLIRALRWFHTPGGRARQRCRWEHMVNISFDPDAGTLYWYFTELEAGSTAGEAECEGTLLLDADGR